jgi:hypothetical protein
MRGWNLAPAPHNHVGCVKLRVAPTSTEANLRDRQPIFHVFLPETGSLFEQNWALESFHRAGCTPLTHAALTTKIRTKTLFTTTICKFVNATANAPRASNGEICEMTERTNAGQSYPTLPSKEVG